MGNSTYWEKKVSLIAFRQVFKEILPATCNQLRNYDLFEKAWLKLSPLIQSSSSRIISQNHAPGISLLTKNVKKLLHAPDVDCPLPLNLYGKPWGWTKSYPREKHLLISPIRKTPFNRFKSFAIKSLILYPSNSNFQVITLCNLHL